MEHQGLRPIERVIVRLSEAGQGPPEISRRIGKAPGTVTRIMTMIDLRSDSRRTRVVEAEALRPVERVVMKLRARGESYGEIGIRLRKSGEQVRRIESYAQLKLEG